MAKLQKGRAATRTMDHVKLLSSCKASIEGIISRIFSFAGIDPRARSHGGLQALCKILVPSAWAGKPPLGCADADQLQSKKSLPSQVQTCTMSSLSSVGFCIGDSVQIWSASSAKWFEDGQIQDIRSDGCVFVRYNELKPSGKWIPPPLANRLLRRSAKDSHTSVVSTLASEQIMLPECGGIFAHCVVFLSPLGGTCMTSQRRQLLQARVREAGAAVCESWSRQVTHLVVVPEVTEETLKAEYPGLRKASSRLSTVTDLWLCNSLVQRRRLPERDYKWRSTRQSPQVPPVTPPPRSGKRVWDQPSTDVKRQRKIKHEGKCERFSDSSRASRKIPFTDGDRCCPQCGQHDFSKRSMCWRSGCESLRPGSDAGQEHGPSESGAACKAPLPNPAGIGRSPKAIIEIIEEEFRTCADSWAARGDKWRSWQYKKAELLMKQARDLSRQGLEQLGLTSKFVQKCEEIQQQGFLDQASCFRKDTDMCTLLDLTRIHGVGEKLAHRWLKLGVRTLNEVRAQVDRLPSAPGGPPTGLSKSQRLALQFVGDFQTKICRAEVERFTSEVQTHIRDLSSVSRVVPCGSYRAGEDLSSSVILLICHNDGLLIGEESERILERLRTRGLVVADLSCGTAPEPWSRTACRPAGGEPPYARVFLGVARGLPSDGEAARFRRLDLVFCSREALPFASIQWTGNDGGIFNRELKRIAAFRGFHLSTTFLCKAEREGVRGHNVGTVCRTGACIACAEEKDVFAALGLAYRPPECRRVDADMLAAVEQAAATVPAFRLAVKADFDRMGQVCGEASTT